MSDVKGWAIYRTGNSVFYMAKYAASKVIVRLSVDPPSARSVDIVLSTDALRDMLRQIGVMEDVEDQRCPTEPWDT